MNTTPTGIVPSGSRILVCGGSGFLGSHVADALTEAGYAVTIFDRSPSPWLQPSQEMVVGDIMDFQGLCDAAEGCQAVYNFAGIADIDEAHEAPTATASFNIIGNLNVMEAARAVGANRFVFASTVYVYSDAGSFYRVSKQASEQFIEAFSARYGLAYTILRFGSLYGPRSDGRNSIWRMVHQALRDNRITYGGDPEAMREYIHVTDAARLSAEILAADFMNRHLVLTGPERLKVREVMQMIAEMLPGAVELTFDPASGHVHYALTPYRYSPKVGHKLIPRDFVDIGQGLLDCIGEAHAGKLTDPAA